ncbi:MAG: hypothetical protein WBQ64_04845 [Terriglobales bacterium]
MITSIGSNDCGAAGAPRQAGVELDYLVWRGRSRARTAGRN